MAATVPDIAKLAEQALDGDQDAALLLARSRPCKGFLSFLAYFVPDGQMTVPIFDCLSDAYRQMENERDLDKAMTAKESA
jgi:hypothetical protein